MLCQGPIELGIFWACADLDVLEMLYCSTHSLQGFDLQIILEVDSCLLHTRCCDIHIITVIRRQRCCCRLCCSRLCGGRFSGWCFCSGGFICGGRCQRHFVDRGPRRQVTSGGLVIRGLFIIKSA